VRSGQIPVTAGARDGSTVTVWTDAFGHPAAPPAGPSQQAALAALAAVLAAADAGLVLLCAQKLARWVLDKRRLAAWDTGWRATGPRWSSRG